MIYIVFTFSQAAAPAAAAYLVNLVRTAIPAAAEEAAAV